MSALLLLVALALPDSMWVVASRANVRSHPKPTGRLVVKLRLGAKLKVHDTKEDWVEVEASSGARGWIHRDLLWEKKPTLEALRAELARAPEDDIATRRQWAERAAAVAPENLEIIRELEAILVKAGDKRALRRVRAAIETIESDPFRGTMIGVCDEKGRAVLIASVVDGELRNLVQNEKIGPKRAGAVAETMWFGAKKKTHVARRKPKWLRSNETQHERLTKAGDNPYKDDSWWKLMVGNCGKRSIFSNAELGPPTAMVKAKIRVDAKWHVKAGPFVVVAYDAVEDGAGRHYFVTYAGADIQHLDVHYDIRITM